MTERQRERKKIYLQVSWSYLIGLTTDYLAISD
jgi:hypothetical protein